MTQILIRLYQAMKLKKLLLIVYNIVLIIKVLIIKVLLEKKGVNAYPVSCDPTNAFKLNLYFKPTDLILNKNNRVT